MKGMENTNSQNETAQTPAADFSFQFSAQREYLKVEKKIFNILKVISKQSYKEKKRKGERGIEREKMKKKCQVF